MNFLRRSKGRLARPTGCFCRIPVTRVFAIKRVHATEPIMSVRVGLGYRALGTMHGEDILWFWIGSHADYDRLVR